jgi:hypothetical protein
MRVSARSEKGLDLDANQIPFELDHAYFYALSLISGKYDSRKLTEEEDTKGGPRISSQFRPRPSPSKEKDG